MKKLGLFLLFATLSSSLACAPSVEDILENMIEAQGGRAALAKILDREYRGTMSMDRTGTDGLLRMYQKMPNKLRLEIELAGMALIQTYDGVAAWEQNHLTGQTREMPDKFARSLERQALGLELILNPEKWGVTYAYMGRDVARNKNCYVLEQSFSDGYKSTLYVDSESYLLVKTQATEVRPNGAEVQTETYYSDYREVEGVSIPYRISVVPEGQESMQIILTDVSFNSELPDSLFVITR